MKREKIEIIGKLPETIRLRTDLGGKFRFRDFTEGALYHPIFAALIVPSEDAPKELAFVFADDKGVISTLPAWYFTVASTKRKRKKS